MLELFVLLTLLMSLLIAIHYTRRESVGDRVEAFEENGLDSCPPGYKTFYQNNGNVACCSGEMLGTYCLGESQCVLTGNGTDEMPNCIHYLKNTYKAKGRKVCPISMPNYFENTTTKKKACTSDRLNATLSNPLNPTAPQCIVYATEDQNIISKNSCYNQRELDRFPCFGQNCKKSLLETDPSLPPLHMISFTDSNGMIRTSFTRGSIERFLNKREPNWKERFNLDRRVDVAEVAKKFFVDRTLSKSEIDF